MYGIPAKTDCDVLMMQAISVDNTYVNLKGVTWVSWTDDVGVSNDVIYIKKGYKKKMQEGCGAS